MCTGTKRAGGHSHLDTQWGLSCFSNCFPHPTQPIQSHLYELTLIRTSEHLGWTQIYRFIISCGCSREGQERQRQLNACKGTSWNKTRSLSHIHTLFEGDSALLLSEITGWLVYKCHFFIFYYRSQWWHFRWIICAFERMCVCVFRGPWNQSNLLQPLFFIQLNNRVTWHELCHSLNEFDCSFQPFQSEVFSIPFTFSHIWLRVKWKDWDYKEVWHTVLKTYTGESWFVLVLVLKVWHPALVPKTVDLKTKFCTHPHVISNY